MASWLKVKAGRCPPRCSPKNGLLKSAPSTMKLLKMPRCPPMLSSSPSGPCEMVAPRRQERQAEVVAAVARQPVDDVLGDALRAGHVGRVDRRRQVAEDGDRLLGHHAQVDGQLEHLPHPEAGPLDALGPEARGRGGHRQVERPGRQQRADERAGGRGLHRGQQIGLPVLDDDDGARQRVAELIADRPADDAGRRPRLGRRGRRVEAGHRGEGSRGKKYREWATSSGPDRLGRGFRHQRPPAGHGVDASTSSSRSAATASVL